MSSAVPADTADSAPAAADTATDATFNSASHPQTHRGYSLGEWENEFDGVVLPPKGSPERDEMERRLKLKLDFAILPMVFIMYILNYLDRNNIAAARLGTLIEDLNLTGTQYSTCVSILFVGYISMQIPSNLLLERIGHPNIYIPVAMMIWGVLSAATAAAHSFAALVVIRIIIGFAEAAFYPGVIFYLSCWYTRKEIAKRSSIFVSGSWISGAFSGLIAYGVMENLDGVRGLASWRWLFLIEGVITVGVAFLAMFILPSLPATTRWLSKEERLLGIVRMIEDIGQADDDHDVLSEKKHAAEGVADEKEVAVTVENAGLHKASTRERMRTAFRGFTMAVKDLKIVNFFLVMFFFATTAGVNTVFPTIVGSLGYDRPKTLLLTVPPWVFCSVTMVINSFHSDATGERFWHMVWGPCLGFIGFIIGISTTQTAARYVAMMLLLQVYASWALGYAWLSNSVPRPPIKRAAAVACVNVGGNIPNIFVPYLYSNASPHFYGGFSLGIAAALLGLLGVVTLRFQLVRLNKKLARGEVVDGLDGATSFRFLI